MSSFYGYDKSVDIKPNAITRNLLEFRNRKTLITSVSMVKKMHLNQLKLFKSGSLSYLRNTTEVRDYICQKEKLIN